VAYCTDGTLTFERFGAEVVEGGSYAILKDMGTTVDVANGTCSVALKFMCDWPATGISGSSSTDSYDVANIRFGTLTIRWDAPVNIADAGDDVEYRVLLQDATTGEWIYHATTSGTDVPNFTAPVGTYNKVSVLTMVNGVESGCTHEELSLTVSEATQTSATPASVTFTADPVTANKFTVTVTGLTPNKAYMLCLSSQDDGDGDSSTSGCVMADENGTVVFNMGGSHTTEMATNGYYRIIEQVSSNVNGTICVTEYGYCVDWTAATLSISSSDPE